MARTGRPPKPTELKRKQGNPGKRSLPVPVVTLPAANGTPKVPSGLTSYAEERWGLIWESAALWLNPALDGPTVERVCRLYDEIALLENDISTRGHILQEPIITPRGPAIDPQTGEVMTKSVANPAARLRRDAEKQLQSWLIELGFTPSARARLGLAEVKRQSKLEELMAKRQERANG